MTQVDSSSRGPASNRVGAGTATVAAVLSHESAPGAWRESAAAASGPGRGPARRAPPHRRLVVRLALVAVLATVPAAGLALWQGLEARGDVVSGAVDDGLDLARALSAQHRLAVEDGRRALAALASAPGAAAEACGPAAAGPAARPGLLAAVTRFSADLATLCSTAAAGQARPLRIAAERARAEGGLATGPGLPATAAAAGPADGRPLVPLAHVTPDGGAVAALLDPAWLSPRLAALLPAENALVVVTDGAGHVVATVPRRPALAGSVLDVAPGSQGGALPVTLDGRPMLLAQAPADGGLAVGVAFDRTAVTADADAALLRSGGGIALALLAGLLLAGLAARAMVARPVARLSDAAAALQGGGTPSRIGPPYAGTAELADLERALDTLGERLSRHEAALISSETQLSVKRQSEERFRNLVELAPEAIVVEARGTVLYANSRAVDLFGADGMEELLAVPLIDHVHPEDRDEVRRRLSDATTDGAVGVAEVRVRRLGGGELVAEVVVGPIAYGGRPATHIMIRDVTDQRLARRRLRESEERFRALVESAPDLILAHDRGRIVLANARAAQVLFGESYGESVVGRCIFDIVDDADRTAAIARMQEFGKAPRPLPPVEMALKRADGGRMICEVMTSPVTFEGRLCLHTVLRDVTARKAEQASVAQSAKLATLGELAAGMAHELAQPMNIIRMAAEAGLLGLDAAGPAKPGAAPGHGHDGTAAASAADRDRLELIAAQAGRMGEIIDHMRVFTRRDTGPEERFDAVEAVRAALAMIDHGLRGDGITVTVDLPEAETACVRGRPVQLEQVVLNLLTNARDAVLERLSAGADGASWRPEVRVSCAAEGAAIVIRVADTGVGVPEALRERLFDPFVTSKAAGIGTGLGLSISDGLIRAMGGRIGLEAPSADGGAVFTVSLPRDGSAEDPCGCDALRPAARQAAAPVTAPVAGAMVDTAPAPASAYAPEADEDEEASALVAHVLVADDEREAAGLMADYLRARGHRVSVAHDGLAAIDIFMDDPADVLVTDMRMPGCDGRNLIAGLRKHVPELPVVVVTGHIGAREARGLETDDQVAAVLRKPVSLQRVADLVDTLFTATL
ncbi:PAS domain S-box protein [Caenispirillum salinarum]|uniref:PAS domain S-box protein n=1 Tax=Caenispirillum salinarum TaxID=859058 RepID=UPI000689C45C|nr:PAS domain S-box protein [Caenispirillum salinarum]